MGRDKPRDIGVYLEEPRSPSSKVKPVDDDEVGPPAPPPPVENANFFSRLFFANIDRVMFRGYKQKLGKEDLHELHPDNKAHIVAETLQLNFDTEMAKVRDAFALASTKDEKQAIAGKVFFRAVVKSFGKLYILPIVLMVFWSALSLIGPGVLLREILAFIAVDTIEPYVGYLYALAMFFAQFFASLCIHHTFASGQRLGLRLRGAVLGSVYRKTMKLSSINESGTSVGEVMNIVAGDAERLFMASTFTIFMFGAPLSFIASNGLLIGYVGPSALAGLAMIVVLSVIQGVLGKRISNLRKQAVQQADERVRLLNETLVSVKLIKFLNWEDYFVGRIGEKRSQEVSFLLKLGAIKALNILVTIASPIFVLGLIFVAYIGSGQRLTPDAAFSAMSLLGILMFPLAVFPQAVKWVSEARVSMKRVGFFLALPEIDEGKGNEQAMETISVKVDNGSFRWLSSPDAEVILKGISLNYDVPVREEEKGKVVAVIGAVGTGKSSLLGAILGNMYEVGKKGSVKKNGTIAYCAQEPWVLNATMKDNILFGLPFDQKKYDRTIHACSLTSDIELLPAGDMTEIGERGINLSGGQKARVSLARAVYADPQIVLLDDPLSAVDAHVGKHIFEECIKGVLKGKLVFLVTHQLQYAKHCDSIVMMGRHCVDAVGTYDELMTSNSHFSQLIKAHTSEGKETKKEAEAEAAAEKVVVESVGVQKPKSLATKYPSTPVPPNKKKGGLMVGEEKATGGISWRVISEYVNYGANWGVMILIIIAHFIMVGGRVGLDYYIVLWTNQTNEEQRNFTGAAIYLSSGLGLWFYGWAAITALIAFCLRASKNLHNDILKKVFRAKMAWFDVTPVGRIINRFSKDMDEADDQLPEFLVQAYDYWLIIISTLVVVGIGLPYFLLTLPVYFIIFFFVAQCFRRASRELKRWDGISRSPVYANLSTSIQGLDTIRAYGFTQKFIERQYSLIDTNQAPFGLWLLSQRWLAFRLDSISAVITCVTAIFAVAARSSGISPAVVGLVVSYSMRMAGLFQWTLRCQTEAENRLIAVERISSTSRVVEIEADRKVEAKAPPAGWPAEGGVAFKNLGVQYRPGLPRAVTDLSLTIKPQEKVGIVGRTGSGKSTLLLALFRIVEPCEGTISIDGVDYTEIGLDDLRSRIAIVPQDPQLFIGTVRSNLDPFNDRQDAQIWDALRRVGLKKEIEMREKELDCEVKPNGENFSLGQRQLLCMARALLRESKIILMDEATAAVDMKSDLAIQKLLRSEFQDCTVITIAHRLNTIIDADKILLMKDGRMEEFDSPAALLSNKDSHFGKLVDETGASMSAHLRKIARGELSAIEFEEQLIRSRSASMASDFSDEIKE
uniref:ATP-dependent transporter ycf16 n=1 Tax=Palpitomonas bilix TaxID=652834 RepID=A0A7S3CY71_9EUKA